MRWILSFLFLHLCFAQTRLEQDTTVEFAGVIYTAQEWEHIKSLMHQEELEAVKETNRLRVMNNLKALKINIYWTKKAKQHSSKMAQFGGYNIFHSDANFLEHRCSENIAAGQAGGVWVARDWYNSPGHQRNMLDQRNLNIAVGLTVSPNGIWYWTQIFQVF